MCTWLMHITLKMLLFLFSEIEKSITAGQSKVSKSLTSEGTAATFTPPRKKMDHKATPEKVGQLSTGGVKHKTGTLK